MIPPMEKVYVAMSADLVHPGRLDIIRTAALAGGPARPRRRRANAPHPEPAPNAFPHEKVYVASLAASHGASAPTSAVWRSSAARKSGVRCFAEFVERFQMAHDGSGR